MKKIQLTYFLLIILSACGAEMKNSVSLSGEIKGLANDTLYIYGTDKLHNRMDTIVAKDGKFSASLLVDTLVTTWLQFSNGTEYPLYLNKGDKIEIKGSMTDLDALNIKGNRPNEELTLFLKELKQLRSPSQSVLEDKAEAFIGRHNSSLASIYLFEKYFIQKPQPDFEVIKRVTSRMTGELKDRSYVDELLNRLTEEENASVGKIAPYFSLSNTKGKSISRSDFKDKYLLVNFWASWDDQSRKTNTSLRKLFKKEQKNKMFGFLGISLDDNKETWKDAIKKDTLTWEQVNAPAGWNADLIKTLAIQALPANILIAPSGQIEGKNLTEEAIQNKLTELAEKEKKEAERKKNRR